MKKTFEFREGMTGLHWTFKTDDGKHDLSIICHSGSYGWEDGEFETMCSWLDDVQGRLSFEQVGRKIKTIYRMEKEDALLGAGEQDG